MILLDTTVLAYAVGGDHPLAPPCREIVDAIGDGRLQATTTVEVIQEFVHVHARRSGRAPAVARASSFIRLLGPLVVVEPEDLELGLRLFATVPALGAFDAVLAAVAIRMRAVALVSADAAFQQVPGLNAVDPGNRPALASLLAANAT